MSRSMLAVLCSLAVLIGACGGSGSENPALQGEVPASEGAAGEGAPSGETSGAVALTAGGFAYAPAAIEATVGDSTTVVMSNDDDTTHSFTLEEFDVDEDVEAGETSEFSFVIDEAGEYEFFCRFHPTMTGTINAS